MARGSVSPFKIVLTAEERRELGVGLAVLLPAAWDPPQFDIIEHVFPIVKRCYLSVEAKLPETYLLSGKTPLPPGCISNYRAFLHSRPKRLRSSKQFEQTAASRSTATAPAGSEPQRWTGSPH
ncbi:MAG: hypothetical protein J2P57_16120 [Acidimicrobiaceae bacterium]|nr:hypothetical protein [Acidimicrobiaceae bacterium]